MIALYHEGLRVILGQSEYEAGELVSSHGQEGVVVRPGDAVRSDACSRGLDGTPDRAVQVLHVESSSLRGTHGVAGRHNDGHHGVHLVVAAHERGQDERTRLDVL